MRRTSPSCRSGTVLYKSIERVAVRKNAKPSKVDGRHRYPSPVLTSCQVLGTSPQGGLCPCATNNQIKTRQGCRVAQAALGSCGSFEQRRDLRGYPTFISLNAEVVVCRTSRQREARPIETNFCLDIARTHSQDLLSRSRHAFVGHSNDRARARVYHSLLLLGEHSGHQRRRLDRFLLSFILMGGFCDAGHSVVRPFSASLFAAPLLTSHKVAARNSCLSQKSKM